MDLYDSVRERLAAYIYPITPETREQESAFESAIDAQAEFEKTTDLESIPGSVASYSIGNYSVTLRSNAAGGAGYTQAALSPTAWAILFNAGLIQHSLPIARRL